MADNDDPSMPGMNMINNDHAGHPFPVQLSRELAARGHEVLHTFTGDLQGPKGVLRRRATDPEGFGLEPLSLRRSFRRYGFVRRFLQEMELGRRLREKVEDFKPDVVVSANTPLGAQAMLARACRRSGAGFVFWLQDLLGVAIRDNLQKKLWLAGHVIGRGYTGLEHRLLRQSRAVVAITEDFAPVCRKAGAVPEKIHVVQNWAPLDELPVLAKENSWARAKGLERTFNFVYSGTLGMKHDPRLLVDLAKAFAGRPQVRVVVISEGLGASFLAARKRQQGLENLVLLPFQPFDRVSRVQAAADVLVAILEPEAGKFAVPSKVLTYLCARRPLLLAVPPENLAARIVVGRAAGIVASPRDGEAFVQGAERLWRDATLRHEMAANGRAYAEETFDIERIADRFERIVRGAVKKNGAVNKKPLQGRMRAF